MIEAAALGIDGLLVESEEARARRDVVAALDDRSGAPCWTPTRGSAAGASASGSSPRLGPAGSVAPITRRMEQDRKPLAVLAGGGRRGPRARRGVPLPIASPSPAGVHQLAADRLQYGGRVRSPASSDEGEHGQPAPDGFRLAQGRRGGRPRGLPAGHRRGGRGPANARGAGPGPPAVPRGVGVRRPLPYPIGAVPAGGARLLVRADRTAVATSGSDGRCRRRAGNAGSGRRGVRRPNVDDEAVDERFGRPLRSARCVGGQR